jgi:hypothetical protein
MNSFNLASLKALRWSGWLLLPVVLLFLTTGYVMDGRLGVTHFLDEMSALTWHRMAHVPLLILVLVHTLVALYLTLQRWGWLKRYPASRSGGD